MAQRDWGGGGELSGLFSDLIDTFQNRAEAAANRQIRQSEEDAAAQDAETYDQWLNGIISDEDWMEYIKKRREDSRNEPEKFQQWTEALRKHGTAIEDGQLESAYQAGEISIHELITHYSGRMSDVTKNSPEYRENADRYWNLVDQRDADYIDEQTSRIVDRIERGQASYRELLNFYQSMASRVRSSSPLKSQINRQITNIRQIVDGVGAGSGGGGGGGGGGSRGGRRSGGGSGGGGGGSSDLPSTLALADKLVSNYYRDGNVFVPTGQAVVQSVFERYNVDATTTAILNGMEADSRYIEQMMENWAADPDSPILRTAFGQQLPNNAETRWAIYNQAIANYDYRASLVNALGNKADQAAMIDIARTNFVEKFMQKDNSIAQQDYWRVRREVFNQSLNLAQSMTNPAESLRIAEQAGRSFEVAAGLMIRKSEKALEELQLDADFTGELRYSASIGQLFRNAKNMSTEEILTAGSMLVDQRPENYFLTTENLISLIGNTDGPTGFGLAGRAAARDGYLATEALRYGQMSEVEPWVYVARPGESQPTLVKKSQVATFLGLSNGDWAEETRPFVERIGVEAVVVYRTLEAYEPPSWYKDKRDRWVPYDQIAKIGRDPRALADAGYTYQPIEELSGWRTVTDSGGATWYVDPADGQLYERLPFRAGINGTFDVEDLVGRNGELNLQRVQGLEGVVMGVGPRVSMRWAQELAVLAAQSGEIDMSLYHSRDIATGTPEFAPMGIDNIMGMYWSEADAALERQNKAARDRQNLFDDTHENFNRRIINRRNEMKRIARLREWYDDNDARTLRREGRAEQVIDDSITAAARQAGINIGNQQADVKRPKFEVVEGKKRAVAPAPKIAPLRIDQLNFPRIVDPKITAPTVTRKSPTVQEPAYTAPITRSPAYKTSAPPTLRSRLQPRVE